MLSLADDHEARRVLVEAVDQTGPGSGLAFGGRQLLEVVQQAIDQRARKVAESGMDHQSGRLVQHRHIDVLVANVEGNVLGDQLEFAHRLRELQRHNVVGTNLVVGLDRLAVDADVSALGRHL